MDEFELALNWNQISQCSNDRIDLDIVQGCLYKPHRQSHWFRIYEEWPTVDRYGCDKNCVLYQPKSRLYSSQNRHKGDTTALHTNWVLKRQALCKQFTYITDDQSLVEIEVLTDNRVMIPLDQLYQSITASDLWSQWRLWRHQRR